MGNVLGVARSLVRTKGITGLVLDPWNELEASRPSHITETEFISDSLKKIRQFARRQLRLAGSGAISAEALLLAVSDEEVPSFKQAKRAFETRYVVGLLRRCGGNISRAARLAKKDRKDFYDVIRRTGVNPSDFR